MEIILSIIIPVYNVEKYIFQTLDSIFSQEVSLELFEVIIVNDGTPDHSMEIVNKFVSNYGNINVISQENQGLSGARNSGIKAAKGRYIWFVDSDDMIEEDILDKMIPLLKSNDVDVYSFKIREYNEQGLVLLERSFLDNKHPEYCEGLEMIRRTARYHIPHTPMQMHVIKTAFLRDNQLEFVRGIYHEDMEFAPRMLLLAKRVCYMPLVAYKYVKRGGSITTNPKLMEKRIKNIKQIAVNHINVMNGLSGRERQIFSFAVYRDIAYLHALTPQNNYMRWYNNLDVKEYRSMFNRVVFMNLNFDHNWKRLPRQICYIISPWILKRLGKNL